ncbi:hypothetical protein [Povalibacter sp.]|uniref:hypothetical protein n=1 Tax=Povalibacter sp. TaxID=1962978 RepID=UPI002F416B8D
MKTRRACASVGVLAFLAATSAVFAVDTPTQKQIEDAINASVTFVDGEVNPELVPEHIRCKHFFSAYGDKGTGFQAQRAGVLTADEQSIMLSHSSRAQEDWQIEIDLHRQAWMEIASHADGKSGLQLAIEIKEASDESEARQLERCSAPLQRLSPAAQRAVRDFAYAKIRPQVLSDNPVVVATALPDYYKMTLAVMLEYERTGKLPPVIGAPESQSEAGARTTSRRPAKRSNEIQTTTSRKLGMSPTP